MGIRVAFDGGRHITSEVVPLALASLVIWMRIWRARSLRAEPV
jgi:hypothetical protein